MTAILKFTNIALSIIVILLANSAQADSVSMPIHQLKKPPVDLVDSHGNKLDAGNVAGLAQSGTDISTLNPQPDKMWQNWGGQFTGQSMPASDFTGLGFPNTGADGVSWQFDEAASDDSYMARYMSRVQSLKDPSKNFRMTLSRSANAALLRAALLRKIGYYIPSPKLYKDLRVQFKSEDEKNDFLKNSQAGMGTDFDSRHWITSNDPDKHSIVLASAVLELATPQYYDLAWGIAPPANNPANVAALQYFSNYRSFRALIIPYVLADIPESVNRYSPKIGAVMGDQVVLTHPFAQSFSAVDFQDARWIVRKILDLKEADVREIIKAADLPPQLVDLTYAKFVYRIKNLSELFSDSKSFDLVKLFKFNPLPNLNVSSADGIVKDGKVTQELIPGYPQRFSHGDRQSPYSEGDLFRYLKIDGITSALGYLIDQMNTKLLQISTVQDIAVQHQQDTFKKLIDQFMKDPTRPLQQQVAVWGGPVAGANVSATRHVGTGTYFNSTATLQLVDDISVSGSIGYFGTVDGLNTSFLPSLSGNLVLTRDYSHVRPLLSMTESGKVSWGNLFVPAFMKSVSSILDKTDLVKSANANDPPQYPLDAFMNDLREGEVFVITDTITTAAALQVTTPLDLLMGIGPLSFVNSLTLEGDASRVILGQTIIMRSKEGFQVFVRKQHSTVLGAQFDVNFFLKLLSARIQHNNTDIATDAFVLDYDPAMMANLDLTDSKNKKYVDLRNNLRLTIRSLLKGNDSEFLYSKFKDRMFKLDHELVTTQTRTNFLMATARGFDETHLLKVTPPAPAGVNKTTDDSITLFAAKSGELMGYDPISGFFINIFNAILGNQNVGFNWNSVDDPNPANSPYGSAFWKVIDSEKDLTSANPKYPVSAYIQHVWGGWSIKQKKFFSLIDEIEAGMQQTQLAPYHLIDKSAFATVKSVDFYRITEQVSFLDKGIYKIRDLITEPQSDNKPVEKKSWLSGFFSRITGKTRPNDQDMFDEMMKLIGGGDSKLGYQNYLQACKDSKTDRRRDGGDDYTYEYYEGTGYECLMPWMEQLIDLSRSFPKEAREQAIWLRDVIHVLDGNVSLPLLLKYLGPENYLFFVRVNGFRSGDEDGDLEYFSNTVGQPPSQFEYSNGLINYWATKARISPLEMNRTNGGFQ